MHLGEISEFQWERPRGLTRISTTFQVRARPKARWRVRLGPLIWMKCSHLVKYIPKFDTKVLRNIPWLQIRDGYCRSNVSIENNSFQQFK